jgi:hypothetical protein
MRSHIGRLLVLALLALQPASALADPSTPTVQLNCPVGRVAVGSAEKLDALDGALKNPRDPEGTRVLGAPRGGAGATPAGVDYDAVRGAAETAGAPPTTSINVSVNAEKGAIQYSAPKRRISSAMMKAAPRDAPAANYLVTGKSATRLAQESVGATGDLEELGKGGMQVVYADPTDATKALKVYDGEVLYGVAKRPYLRRIEEAKALIATGDPTKVADGKRIMESAEIELEHLARDVPRGKAYPPRYDDVITRMIQRQKALGPELRNEVLPKIKIPRTDGAGDIKITMCQGLEDVSEFGVTRVERVRLGAVNFAGKTDTWVDAAQYAEQLDKGGLRYKKLMEADKAWREALAPYSERMKEANHSLGIPLSKGSEQLGYDIGVGKSPFTNVFVRVDGKGTVVEIKVSDY